MTKTEKERAKSMICLKVREGVSEADLRKLLATLEARATCERLFPNAVGDDDDEIFMFWAVKPPKESYDKLLADLQKSALIEFAEAPAMHKLLEDPSS